MTMTWLKKKYREGKQFKSTHAKSSGDNPQNNPRVARKKGRLGMNAPHGWGSGPK